MALAESGIFKIGKLTALESVERAPLYDAFHYLSAQKAQAKFQSRVHAEILAKQKRSK